MVCVCGTGFWVEVALGQRYKYFEIEEVQLVDGLMGHSLAIHRTFHSKTF